MTRRHLGAAAGLLLAAPAVAEDDDAARLSVRIEAPPGGPLVQEMLRITVRAIFRAQPNQVTLTQPEFSDARWLMVGEDVWSEVSLGGPARVMLQRRLAWFAQRSGTLTVGAFTLQAMVLTPDLARVATVRRTAPFTVAVRPAVESGGAWWLPARTLRLTDTFNTAPGGLTPGAVLRRVVTVEASGIEAPQLPPLPPLHVAGVIAFAQPVVTRTTMSANGPTVRATYAWDIKPVNDAPALLPEIRLPWFDTQARAMREAVLPAVRVSLAAAAEPAAAPAPPRPGASIGPRVGVGLGSFLVATGAMAASKLPWRTHWTRASSAAAVWLALRRGDAAGLRRLLAGVSAQGAPESVRAALAALDRHLYAQPPAPMPRLDGLVSAVFRQR